jgi:hypothetical protein
MGSSGTGSFTDYLGPRRDNAEGASADAEVPSGDHVEAGAPENGEGVANPCLEEIPEFSLEDVERCAYFTRTRDVPPAGTDVTVLSQLVGGRIAVAAAADGEVIGLVPTRFNNLLGCLRSGFTYPGEVSASSATPLAVVRVVLTPTG